MVAVAIAALYRYVALENFKEMRTQQNVELAHSLSNTLLDDVRKLRDLSLIRSWEEMQTDAEVARFAELIESQLKHLRVFTVNVFATDGLMLYSTERQRIGAKMLLNEGVEIASTGLVTSAIFERDSFNRFDRIIEDRDMVETYLPLFDESGEVIGIFEIHSDISDFFARVESTQRIVGLGTGAALFLLYLLLVGLFWRSDHQLFASGSRSLRSRLRGGESETVSKAKSEFVATISHELRTPLNAVLGMTDLLNLTSLTRKQREYIQTIQSSGDMLISLIDNLLDFSHLEAGDLKLQSCEFDVMDLIERVLKVMGHSAYSKGLELIGNIGHDLDLRVAADKRRLQQILINVISNAIKFTDSGEIVISASARDEEDGLTRLCVSVVDTGIGIDKETRDHLFAAFASGERPASGQKYGSGLGLTISKRLLDKMDGSIDLRNREEGGAEVNVEVPVRRVTSSSSSDLAVQREGGPGRVLSLHANRSAAQSICNLLRKWDIDCETMFDIEECLHRLRVAASGGKPFECVIIDSALTSPDRLMIVRRIRRSSELEKLPVVLLTSITEPLAVGEVSALGRLRCVNKPVLPLELRYNLLRSVQESQDPAPADSLSSEASASAEGLRILIAEDNPVSSAVLQSMLRTEGCGADVVDNGPAVLEALQDRPYDLLLLDCQMPGMDGDFVTQAIREHAEKYHGNPVIVAVTADTTEEHRAQCIAAGMDDFVPKPLRLEGLRKGLVRWTAMVTSRGESARRDALVQLRDSLVQRTGYDDETFLNDYIGLFLADTKKRLAELSSAFISGDSETVRRDGHALKGACLEMGADRMARFCDDLSAAAKQENLDDIGMIVGKLDREFTRLRPVYESAQVRSISPS